MRTLIYRIIAILVVMIVIGGIWTYLKRSTPEQVTNFEECAAAGNPVMESYPRQCRTTDGARFVEDIGNEITKTDEIRLNNPRPNQTIQSPLIVEGEAKGYWFFEGSFVIFLLNRDGNVIASTDAEAQGEWMTEEFVPFRAVLEFQMPSTKVGLLLLQKENPSGLPENDDELVIPVVFK